nr:MAG TPA: tail protein [Caudoviricetes sp.]
MAIVEDQISFARVEDGDDGRGILGTPVATYGQSTSGTTPPTTWSATRPNVPAGQYLWTRVVTTYTDNTTSETQTPTLMGKPGDPGLGIKSKSVSYAVGTTGNTPPTNGWQEAIPNVSANQYLWTKTTLIYTDESKTEAYSVGKMGANGADAKLLYLTASAENMAFNADDTPKTTQTINISAKLQNVTGTATFTAIPYIGNTAQTAITLGGSGNTRTLTSAQWNNKDWTLISITATLDNLSDTLSIVKVKDGATGDKGDQGNQGIPGTPGADGRTPYTHWAYAWSADGKDRLTSSYPNENLVNAAIVFENNYIDSAGALTASASSFTTDFIQVSPNDIFSSIQPYESSGYGRLAEYDSNKIFIRRQLLQRGWSDSGELQFAPVGSTTAFIRWSADSSDGTYKVGYKLQKGTKPVIYTPNPADDFTNAYPTYAGTYTDYEPTDSEDPSKYTWQRILGESGQDGSDGKDGANGQDAKEVISGYLSNDSIIVPANASGTVTDFTKALGDFIIYEGQTKVSSGVTFSKVSETGMTSTINSAGRYTVTALSADVGTSTYQAVYKSVSIQKIMIVVKNKQGATGPAGTNGADGKGIVSNSTTYQAGTSGTTPPTGTWSTSIPSVSENQYLWTKIVLTYSDNTNSTAYSVGKMGAKGETGATGSTGATGASGNGIKSTTINFASSTSGTTAPSSGWSTSIPTVAAGSFLWTRTVLTFTDNTTNTSYTVAKQGEKGDPTGIISQATVPSNPYVGMLWQNTGASGYIIGATYQWNGSKFNLYIFTADNIVATTLSAITANLGNVTAGTLTGVTFVSPFDFWDGETVPGGTAQMWRKGQTTVQNGEDVTMWEDYNKSTGAKIKEGGVIQNSNGFSVFVNDPSGYSQRSSVRMDGILIADSRGVGGATSTFLTYSDLVKIQPIQLTPATGWSVYATSGSNRPIGSRTGRIVTLSGAFKNNSVLSNSNDVITIGSVPNALRPISEVKIIVKGAGTSSYMLIVDTDGLIKIQYRLGWTGSQYGYIQNNSGDIFNIHVTYPGVDIF